MISIKFALLCSTYITYLITYANGGVVTFIDPCTPDDQACILASARKALPYVVTGIPELGLPSSDPLIIDTIEALEGDLKLSLNDVKIDGLKNCQLLNLERNGAEGLLTMVAECPILLSGKYQASGKVIFVPIDGIGQFTIKTDNIRIKSKVKIDGVERDGKKYWIIVNKDLDFEPVEKVFFDFGNLYNGDNEKAAPLLKLFDQSWLELTTSLGKPIIKQIFDTEVERISQFFNIIPVNELEKA